MGNQNIKRLRIGIGHPRSLGLQQSVSNFVLQKPSSEQGIAIRKIIEFCSNFLNEITQMDSIQANSFLQHGVKQWD